MPTLQSLGWNDRLTQAFQPHAQAGLQPARVIGQEKSHLLLALETGTQDGIPAGRLRHEAHRKADLPAVGDWVAIAPSGPSGPAIIHAVLPRQSSFARKPAISGGRKLSGGIIVGGATEEQIIAANIDTAFIVMGMDGNFNIARLERYITLVYSSGAYPVVLLNKADLAPDPTPYITAAQGAAIGLDIHPVSGATGVGLERLEPYLRPGRTVVFLGSSGVGKSTLINRLLGEDLLKTQTVSEATGKGRHTTTGARLITHRSGCLMVDTAGMRELQLWAEEEALAESFEDVFDLVAQCRYSDCQHETEPGCAVRQAVAEGRLSAERFESFKKQHTELGRLRQRRRQRDAHFGRILKRTIKPNE